MLGSSGWARFVPFPLLQLHTRQLPLLITTWFELLWTHIGQTGGTPVENVKTPVAEEVDFLPEPLPSPSKRVHDTPLFIPSYPPVRQLVPRCVAQCLSVESPTTFAPLRQLSEVQNESCLAVLETPMPHLRWNVDRQVLLT